MNNEIELLQNWLARHRQTEMNYDCNPTQYECQIFDAIEHIIAENAQYSEHNMKLEQALIDTDRLMQEYLSKCLDLEHRLSNCIEPKFKVGQEAWIIHLRKVKKSKIFLISWDDNFIFRYGLEGDGYLLEKFEDELFITAEEALKKLEELKNGN